MIVGSAITRPATIAATFIRAMNKRAIAIPAIGVDTGVDRTIAIPATILGTDLKHMDMPNSLTLNVRVWVGGNLLMGQDAADRHGQVE